ncbi:hypothetical protein D3C85_703430 [compost metagenome]
MLDAKAAAGIFRCAQTQAVAGHIQGTGHDRVQRIGALEIGQHVINAGGALVLSQHHIAFNGCAGTARKLHFERDLVRRLLERLLRLAITKAPFVDHVAADCFVQDRRLFGGGQFGIDDRGQRLVFNAHTIDGVFGQIAALSDHHGHRLSNVAHLVDGDAPVLHRLTHTHRERQRPAFDVFADQYAVHAFHQQRFGKVHRGDPRMSVG